MGDSYDEGTSSHRTATPAPSSSSPAVVVAFVGFGPPPPLLLALAFLAAQFTSLDVSRLRLGVSVPGTRPRSVSAQ
jgi:hypothetical protein